MRRSGEGGAPTTACRHPLSRPAYGGLGDPCGAGAGYARGGPRSKDGKAEVKRRDNIGVNEAEKKEIEAEWDALWERVQLMFDEDAEAAYNRRVEVAQKKLKRAGLEEPPLDMAKIKKALVRYSHTLRYSMALEEAGVSKLDMQTALDLWPMAKSAVEFLNKVRDGTWEIESVEKVARYREQLDKLATDDKGKCKASVKAVMFALGQMDRKHFGQATGPQVDGEDEGKRTSGGGGGGILVRVIGDAAKLCEAPPQNRLEDKARVFIDV